MQKLINDEIQTSDRLLIFGGKKVGKTSFAFRLAYEIAEEGGIPLFICNQVKIEGNLPLFIFRDNHDTSNWCSDILSRIQMKYISNSKELMLAMDSIHLLLPRPTAVFIDDFSQILDPMMAVSREDQKFIDQALINLAHIEDAIFYLENLSEISQSNSVIRLVLTDSCHHAQYETILSKMLKVGVELRASQSTPFPVFAFIRNLGSFERHNVHFAILKHEPENRRLIVNTR